MLRAGGIVALPTDTVYGLIAVAADRAAVERVYEVKVRDPRQPMPIFVASVEQAELIADVNDGRAAADAALLAGRADDRAAQEAVVRDAAPPRAAIRSACARPAIRCCASWRRNSAR